jgi:hypothetical protein
MIKKASYARRLQIDLATKNEEELFKWFLACLFFGKPIQTAIAERAYQELVAARLTNPDAVLRAGWDKLVGPSDRAHYVRYDFPAATTRIFLRDVRPVWYRRAAFKKGT